MEIKPTDTEEVIAIKKKGVALYESGNYQEAINVFNDVLKIAPSPTMVNTITTVNNHRSSPRPN